MPARRRNLRWPSVLRGRGAGTAVGARKESLAPCATIGLTGTAAMAWPMHLAHTRQPHPVHCLVHARRSSVSILRGPTNHRQAPRDCAPHGHMVRRAGARNVWAVPARAGAASRPIQPVRPARRLPTTSRRCGAVPLVAPRHADKQRHDDGGAEHAEHRAGQAQGRGWRARRRDVRIADRQDLREAAM